MSNWFVELEIFEQPNGKVVQQEPRLPKKEQRKEERLLRDVFNTFVDKPLNFNALGSKTLKSTKSERSGRKSLRPKYAKFEMETKELKEDPVVLAESRRDFENLLTLEEYFHTKDIYVDRVSLGKTTDLMSTFAQTADLGENDPAPKRKYRHKKKSPLRFDD